MIKLWAWGVLLRFNLATKRCTGTCGEDRSYHTHDLTWLAHRVLR